MTTKSSGSKSTRAGSLTVKVIDSGGRRGVLGGALVSLRPADGGSAGVEPAPGVAGARSPVDGEARWGDPARTDSQGQAFFSGLPPGRYEVRLEHYLDVEAGCPMRSVSVEPGCDATLCFQVPLEVEAEATYSSEFPRVGDRVMIKVSFANDSHAALTDHVRLVLPPGATRVDKERFAFRLPIRVAGPQQIRTALEFDGITPAGRAGAAEGQERASYVIVHALDAEEREPVPVGGELKISMTRSETEPTADLRLWGAIRASTEALSFDNYVRFMDELFCPSEGRIGDGPHAPRRSRSASAFHSLLQKRCLPFSDTDAYRVLKAATEAFVMVNCGVVSDERDIDGAIGDKAADYLGRRDLPSLLGNELPYLEESDGHRLLPYLAIIRRKLPDVPFNERLYGSPRAAELCSGFVQEKLRNPCMIELIWSYWLEEGMLVQSVNAIARRFQNLGSLVHPDPLANMEINPLRPLSSLLWGYIQDEQHRLTVARRNGEYDHHYGLRLQGRAVRSFRPADTRSRFIEAFHTLLRLCTEFYRRDDDSNVKADAFRVLNALKDVHLILSQGAHCQFGDLPPTARIEMLQMQYLLSRPEFREFLPTRIMVAYPEPWMDRVDALKKLQGWTDTSVMIFHNLAVFGEQLLLAIRYGNWSGVYEPTQAFNFARYWRPQVQGYIHAYHAATGVELGVETVEAQVDTTLPSTLLQRRLVRQRSL